MNNILSRYQYLEDLKYANITESRSMYLVLLSSVFGDKVKKAQVI